MAHTTNVRSPSLRAWAVHLGEKFAALVALTEKVRVGVVYAWRTGVACVCACARAKVSLNIVHDFRR